VLAVLDTRQQVLLGRSVTRELVGDHDAWCPALPLQQLAQQALGGRLVPPALDQHVEHHPVLIHGTPEPVLHPGNPDGDLVKVPLVTSLRQPPPDPVGKLLAELERPLPHGLVADHDAPCRQHFLDHAQAEREAKVEPDRLANHLRWKAIPGIGRLGGWRAHSGHLPARGQSAKPLPS
jgi:hypothetical protein